MFCYLKMEEMLGRNHCVCRFIFYKNLHWYFSLTRENLNIGTYKLFIYMCSVQLSPVQSLTRVWLFAIPWIAARQAYVSITNSRSSLRLMAIESVMPSSHLILCRPLLLLPPIPPRLYSHGILQARILEWVAFPFSRGSSQPRDQTQVSRIAGRFFTSWATREACLASRDVVLNQGSHICSICPLWLRPLSLSRQIWYFLQKIRLPL